MLDIHWEELFGQKVGKEAQHELMEDFHKDTNGVARGKEKVDMENFFSWFDNFRK